MEKDFWLERWERDEIGFHESVANTYLTGYWHEIGLLPGAKVFVPLCGKSVDMLWLREQGYQVLGVELSRIAVQDFFRESGYQEKSRTSGKFELIEANEICIFCGDFFDLKREDMDGVMAVYDRASMVALPPAMRELYVKHLLEILPQGTRILLVTFDYAQHEMAGPPFAVTPAEVGALYKDHAEIRLLLQHDSLAENLRFKKRGLTALQENIFLLAVK